MRKTNMKFKTIYFFAGLIVAAPITSWSQEGETLDKQQRLPFSQRVIIESKQKNEALKDRIRSMSEQEYKSYLHNRVDKAFEEGGNQKEVLIVIEATDKMTESEQHYTNQNTLPTELATQKLQSFLEPLNREKTIDFETFYTMSSRLNIEEQTVRQTIRGMLEYQDVKFIIDQADVIDIHINYKGVNSTGRYMMEIDEQTGRVMPLRERPEEDAEIMNNGWYNEVLDTFENDIEKRTVAIFFEVADIESVKQFLSDWGEPEGKMGRRFAYVYATKEKIKAMKNDLRVRTVRLPARLINGAR